MNDLTGHPDINSKILLSLLITTSGLVVFYFLFYFLKKWSKKKETVIPALIDKHFHISGVLLFLVITLNLDIQEFRAVFTLTVFQTIRKILNISLIISVGYIFLQAIAFGKSLVIMHFEKQERHDYKLRSVRTQFQLIQRILNIVVIILTITITLMTFSRVRQLGATILASAGIAGIVIGFAAQKSLGSILAGIQVAFSQPIKIDDTVVVEGQFGTVGEITLTYVVVNTWDEKRLIVPISYFLEKPFENWTRVSPEVVATIKIYTDYTLPVEQIREKFNIWLKESSLWDNRKQGLLITGANDKTIEVRATMSARNSDDAFTLECLIREKLISYIREQYPQALPSSRINIKSGDKQLMT
jgi:small-conductance mechanosensitive channel